MASIVRCSVRSNNSHALAKLVPGHEGGGADPAAVFDPGAVPADRDVVRDRLRALRHAQGWSQAELGRRLGVASITVSRWETKEHLPSRAQWGWFLRLEAGEALLQPRPEDRPKGVRVVVRDGRVLVGVGSATNLEKSDPDAAVRLAFRLVEAARVCDRAPQRRSSAGKAGATAFRREAGVGAASRLDQGRVVYPGLSRAQRRAAPPHPATAGAGSLPNRAESSSER